MVEKEYTEREAAMKAILGQPSEPHYPEWYYRDIKEIPTADVAPVVHGEWEFRNDGRYRQTRCYCSACGKHSGIGGIRENQMKPYCPNCGAKMDGGKHGET